MGGNARYPSFSEGLRGGFQVLVFGMGVKSDPITLLRKVLCHHPPHPSGCASGDPNDRVFWEFAIGRCVLQACGSFSSILRYFLASKPQYTGGREKHPFLVDCPPFFPEAGQL